MSDADKATVRRIPLEAFNERPSRSSMRSSAKTSSTTRPCRPVCAGREGLKAFIPAVRTASPT